jgi:hypothetical protein
MSAEGATYTGTTRASASMPRQHPHLRRRPLPLLRRNRLPPRGKPPGRRRQLGAEARFNLDTTCCLGDGDRASNAYWLGGRDRARNQIQNSCFQGFLYRGGSCNHCSAISTGAARTTLAPTPRNICDRNHIIARDVPLTNSQYVNQRAFHNLSYGELVTLVPTTTTG